jgi:hypothetical protein
MNRISILALLAALLPAAATRADGYLYSPYATQRTMITADWEYAIPVFSLRSQLIQANSPAGIGLGVRTGIAERLSVGFDFTWNNFQDTYSSGEHATFIALTGMATLHYYLGRSEVQPYVGLGAGAMYRRSSWESGPVQAGFGFCASPQFGVLFTVTRGIALNVLARYVFTTGSFDVDGDGAWRVKYPQWIGLQAGVALY